jgi:hypothetical protein
MLGFNKIRDFDFYYSFLSISVKDVSVDAYFVKNYMLFYPWTFSMDFRTTCVHSIFIKQWYSHINKAKISVLAANNQCTHPTYVG